MSEYHSKPRGVSPPLLVSRLLVLGIAFVVRVAGLQAQGMWRDEVDQWRFAFEPLRDLMANFTRPGWNGPLYSPLLRGWILLTGDSAYAMRYLSLLWGLLGVAVGYVLAVRLARQVPRLWTSQGRGAMHGVGMVMAILMAGSPYLVYYAQEVKMYTWVPLLAMLALYTLDRALARPRFWQWLGVWLAVTLAFYSHILAALLIPVAASWFLLRPTSRRRPWKAGLVTFSGLTLPYLPLLSWQRTLLLVPRETGYPRYTLSGMIHVLLDGWSTGIWQGSWERQEAQVVMMILFGGMAAVGLVAMVASRYGRATARLLIWLGLPLLAIWFVSLWGPIFTDRYLTWSAPAFYLFAAVGVVWLCCRVSRVLTLLVALLCIANGHGIAAQTLDPLKPEYPKVVRSVEARREPGDLLVFQIPYNRYVYDFYAEDGLGAWAEAPFTNWREPDGTYRVDDDAVARQVRDLVSGYERVWLVYSEATLWDDRQLVKAWFDETYERLDAQSFYGVELFLYRRPSSSK